VQVFAPAGTLGSPHHHQPPPPLPQKHDSPARAHLVKDRLVFIKLVLQRRLAPEQILSLQETRAQEQQQQRQQQHTVPVSHLR
jgi:hypothetical protein